MTKMRNAKYLWKDMVSILCALHKGFPEWELEEDISLRYCASWKGAKPQFKVDYYNWEYEFGPLTIDIKKCDELGRLELWVVKRDRVIPDSKITAILNSCIPKKNLGRFVPHRECRERSEWTYCYDATLSDRETVMLCGYSA